MAVLAVPILALQRRLAFNRAVALMIARRFWDGLATPVGMLIIAYGLRLEEQGYYYTFLSIVALQVFVEMGLSTVLVQTASHEWAFLNREPDGRITGDLFALSRLAGLTRFALKWYAIGGTLLFLLLSLGGSYFFSLSPARAVEWKGPWIALSIAAGVALMATPSLSVLEGCNQVTSVYFCRLLAGIVSSTCLWLGILFGCGLYAIAIEVVARAGTITAFVIYKHRQFFINMLSISHLGQFNWRKDVWPFQWRIAVSWLAGYFVFSIFNPIMFHYHGAAIAGQMGMTLTLVMGPYFLAMPWITSRVPRFGMFIAQKDYASLDSMFRRLFSITMCIHIFASAVLLVLVYALKTSDFAIRDRILPVLPVALFLIAWISETAIGAMATYVRAHKREPFMIPAVFGAVVVGLSTWSFGASYGPTGAAAGFALNSVLIGLPICFYIFKQCRSEWHAI